MLHTQVEGSITTDNEMDRTYKLRQSELKHQHLVQQTSRHVYDLTFPHHGPYAFRFDRSGRKGLLMGRRNGGLAVMDMHTLHVVTEFYLRGHSRDEVVRDGVFLHNHTLFALAQKHHVFVYDDAGVEIHRLPDHVNVYALEYLPYHFLLATIGRSGLLRYHDTSTGDLVLTHRTKVGPCSVLRHDPSNAVVHCRHGNGTVTLWSPAQRTYLAKMLCHCGAPVTSLAIDLTGHTMITGGHDNQVKIWDLRTYRSLHSYYTRGGPPTSLDLSQRNVLGIGHGCHSVSNRQTD